MTILDAVSAFNHKNATGQFPLVMIPAHRTPFAGTGWWLTIPTGCHCLLQRFGKNVGVAPPGGSIKPPFYRIAYIVNSQSCTYNAPVKECPTSDNVRVGVDVVLQFNIRDAEAFVYNLGAVHFDQLLSGAVDEGIRRLVRNESHQTVRTLRGNRAESMLLMLNKKFEDAGVSFGNCTITAVILPDQLESSLEHTTEMRKSMIKAVRDHEFLMGEIDRKVDMDLEERNRKNEQTIVTETGKKNREEMRRAQQQVKSNELTMTAMSEANQAAQVKQIEIKAGFARCKVDMERSRVETLSKAEADAEAKRVQADIAFEKAQMNAIAEKDRLLGDGEAIKLDAAAEATATQHLHHKRKHELEMREKDILMKLAQKCNYNLVGEPGDRLVGALMSGHLAGAGDATGNSWFK